MGVEIAVVNTVQINRIKLLNRTLENKMKWQKMKFKNKSNLKKNIGMSVYIAIRIKQNNKVIEQK